MVGDAVCSERLSMSHSLIISENTGIFVFLATKGNIFNIPGNFNHSAVNLRELRKHKK